MPKIRINKKLKVSFQAWGLILPSFAFLSLFTLFPILQTIYKSFFNESLSSVTAVFSGFANYTSLLRDEVFLKAFVNNLIVAAAVIPLSILLAVLMAVFANSVRFGKAFVRVAYFYPTILPMIAVANIWLFIYTPQFGLVSLFSRTVNLLGNPKYVLPAIILMLIWKQAGYSMIFYLSGLQNISGELYEAAQIDGAGPAAIFRRITWPLLKPTTLFVTIITLTDVYKMVDYLYIMTKGGPNNSSNMLLYYIYQTGFDFWDVGKASAISTVLVIMLLTVSCIRFFSQDRKTFYS